MILATKYDRRVKNQEKFTVPAMGAFSNLESLI